MEHTLKQIVKTVTFFDIDDDYTDDDSDEYNGQDIDEEMAIEETEDYLPDDSILNINLNDAFCMNQESNDYDDLSDDHEFTDEERYDNFLQNFGVLPSLTDITQTSDDDNEDEETISEEVSEFIEYKGADEKAQIKSPSTESDVTIESEVKTVIYKLQKGKVDISKYSESNWYDHLDDLYSTDDDAEKTIDQEIALDEEIHILFQQALPSMKKVEVETVIELTTVQVFNAVKDFLDELIELTVNIVAKDLSECSFAKMLDKRQIINDLVKVISEYNNMDLYNDHLKVACTKFYLKHRYFNKITQCDIDMDKHYEHELNEHLKRLDVLLKKEEETKMKYLENKNKLKEEIQTLKLSNEKLVADLENMIFSCIGSKEHEPLYIYVKKQLNSIARTRKLVCKTYGRLTLTQSEKLLLKKEDEELSALGDGITLDQYINLKADVQYLTEKISERNKEIEKYQKLIRHKFHVRAHWNDRVRMLRDNVDCKQLGLQELHEERYRWHKRISQLKQKRSNIQKKIRNTNLDVGLLNKTRLMLDYDACAKRCQDLHEVITDLRKYYDCLQKGINHDDPSED